MSSLAQLAEALVGRDETKWPLTSDAPPPCVWNRYRRVGNATITRNDDCELYAHINDTPSCRMVFSQAVSGGSGFEDATKLTGRLIERIGGRHRTCRIGNPRMRLLHSPPLNCIQ
jgi:hypothetical protein